MDWDVDYEVKPVTINGKTHSLNPIMADAVTKADADMRKETGKGLSINSSYRTNQQQREAYRRYQTGQGGIAAKPGMSRHEKGLAIDVGNYGEAAPYLEKYGLTNPINHDPVHFQFPGAPGAYKPKPAATPIAAAKNMVADSSNKATPESANNEWEIAAEIPSSQDDQWEVDRSGEPPTSANINELAPPRPVEGLLPPGARPDERKPLDSFIRRPNLDLTMGLNEPLSKPTDETKGLETLSNIAEGAVKGAYRMVKGGADIAQHTADLALNAPYDRSKGLFQNVKETLGGTPNQEGVLEPGVGMAEDIAKGLPHQATVIGGALGLNDNTEAQRDLGGTLFNLAMYGKGLEKPLSKTGEVAGPRIRAGMRSGAERLSESALKIAPSVSEAERQAAIDTQLGRTGERGYLPTRKGNAGLSEDMAATHAKVEQIVDDLTKSGEKIKREDAIKGIDSSIAEYSKLPPEVAKHYTEPLETIKAEYQSGNPEMTPREVQDMKKTIYRLHSGDYEKDTIAKVKAEGEKAIAKTAKEELKRLNPEIKSLNAKNSAQIKLKEALERASHRIRNMDLSRVGIRSGIGGIVGYAAGGWHGAKVGFLAFLAAQVLDDPVVKARLAIALDKASRIGEKVATDPRDKVPVGTWENAPVPPEQKLLPPGQGFTLLDQTQNRYSPELAGQLVQKALPAPDPNRSPMLTESEIEASGMGREQKDAVFAEKNRERRPAGPSQAPSRSAARVFQIQAEEDALKPAPQGPNFIVGRSGKVYAGIPGEKPRESGRLEEMAAKVNLAEREASKVEKSVDKPENIVVKSKALTAEQKEARAAKIAERKAKEANQKGSGMQEASKEPWEITKEEYSRRNAEISINNSTVLSKLRDKKPEDLMPFWAKLHKDRVTEAVNAGKPVSAEVLKDYPELTSKETPKSETLKKEQKVMKATGSDLKEQKTSLLKQIDKSLKAAKVSSESDRIKREMKEHQKIFDREIYPTKDRIDSYNKEQKDFINSLKNLHESTGRLTFETGSTRYTINSDKTSLEAFRKQVRGMSTSEMPTTGKGQPSGPLSKRIEGEGVSYYNDFKPRNLPLESVIRMSRQANSNFGEPAILTKDGFVTNGYVSILPNKKVNLETNENWSMDSIAPKSGLVPANEAMEFKLERKIDTPKVQFRSESGKSAIVNAKYVDAVLTEHPNAKAFVKNDGSLIVFKENDKIVGGILPFKDDHFSSFIEKERKARKIESEPDKEAGNTWQTGRKALEDFERT
jgi:hypothetical protein